MIYYGDEIAMLNGVVGANATEDPLAKLGQPSRDPFRTPMLWNNGENAGFCAKNVTPWLPVNAEYKSANVEYNNGYMVGYTALNSFKDLAALRSKESFQWGPVKFELLNKDVMYFTRKAEGFPGYVVVINRGGKSSYSFASIAEKLTMVYDSAGSLQDSKTGVSKTTDLPVYNTKERHIGFTEEGEVYVFKY